MSITVVNIHHKPKGSIYCGRGTPLGNPFVMADESMRDIVCDKYEEWFTNKVMNPDNAVFHEFLDEIVQKAKVEDVSLGCFCAPKRCHCDTIKHYVENKLCMK